VIDGDVEVIRNMF